MKRVLLTAIFIATAGIAHAGWDADTENWTVVSEADKALSCDSLNFNQDVWHARGDPNNPLATTNVSAIVGEQMEWCAEQSAPIRHKYGSRY